MRDFEQEISRRVQFIKERLAAAGADGAVFGNSGGKDSALVGILCKRASPNTVALVMPCGATSGSDLADAKALAESFDIAMHTADLTAAEREICAALGNVSRDAEINIAPRLRMTALYAYAQTNNLLVAGTSNRSERHMGYFTKWGDAGCDFNPIADLTASEVKEFLRYMGGPAAITDKAPSAGLYEGQTDEADMGVTYAELDALLAGECISERAEQIIRRSHAATEHKRTGPYFYLKEEEKQT